MSRKAIVVGLAIVLLVPVYVGLAWAAGHAVHARFDAWEQQVAPKTGQLFKIVERKKTQGIFSSVEELTLELNQALLEEIARPTSGRRHNETSAVNGGQDTSGLGAVSDPWRFTVRNHIQHGPLPGFTGFGIARIDTRLVLDETTREHLSKLIGDREPVVLVTRLGLMGGGVMTLSSPAFEVVTDDSQIAWQGVNGRFAFSRGMNSLECAATAPGMQIHKGDAVAFSLGELSLHCDVDRVFEEIYSGDVSFSLARMDGVDKGDTEHALRMEALSYAAKVAAQGDYLDMAVKLGVGGVETSDVTLKDLQYNLTLKHLHGPTLAAMMRKMKEVSQTVALANPTAMLAMTGAFAEYGPVLLEHSPELVIERIGFRTPDGEVGLTATARLNDFSPGDLAMAEARTALMSKIEATADLWVTEALVQKPWGSDAAPDPEAMGPTPAQRTAAIQQQIAAMEQQGYIRRNNGRLETRVEFKNGALTANGKPLGAPVR